MMMVVILHDHKVLVGDDQFLSIDLAEDIGL